jgi:hypothetical protein
MALTKDVFIEKSGFEGKLTAKNAYWKIEKLEGGKDAMRLEVCASINSQRVQSFMSAFTPTLDGENFIAQAYEHLKTLPEFAGATDC